MGDRYNVLHKSQSAQEMNPGEDMREGCGCVGGGRSMQSGIGIVIGIRGLLCLKRPHTQNQEIGSTPQAPAPREL